MKREREGERWGIDTRCRVKVVEEQMRKRLQFRRGREGDEEERDESERRKEVSVEEEDIMKRLS